ncbi:T9SS type A sorting domain-containing protein [uncultured Flavobacterium sp.]
MNIYQVSNSKVDVSNLAKGIYVLKIISENNDIKIIKFIKE